MQQHSNQRTDHATSTARKLALLTLLAWSSGCGGGKSVKSVGTAGAPGDLAPHPTTGSGSHSFIVEANHRGVASNVNIIGLSWGRLANVVDQNDVLQARDLVISESIATNDTYDLSFDELSERTLVKINFHAGTQDYEQAFLALDSNLTPLNVRSLEAGEVGPYSMLPRNATLVVRFNDLLDPRFDDGAWRDSRDGTLVDAQTGQLAANLIGIYSGYPPTQLHETRVIVDPNHGDIADFDGDGVPEFHPTRVLLTGNVTSQEAANSSPPLAVNALGLPGSSTTITPNLVLRIPTDAAPAIGQTQVLINPTNHSLSGSGEGPMDSESVTSDIVRAMRSGGATGDIGNGYLNDTISPSLIAVQGFDVIGEPVAVGVSGDEYMLPECRLVSMTCFAELQSGDVLVQGSMRACVVSVEEQMGPNIHNLLVRLAPTSSAQPVVGVASLETPYDPSLQLPTCAVEFSAQGSSPGVDVSPEARILLRFSEAMDPDTLRAFDTFSVTRIARDPGPYDYAVGNIVAGLDHRGFKFEHEGLPFSHVAGESESYFLTLLGGEGGPTDLAGNPLIDDLPTVEFNLDPAAPTAEVGGLTLHFDSLDQIKGDGFPEFRVNQILLNSTLGRIEPRAVTRFSVAADRNQATPSVMAIVPGGVRTPLSPLGSKLHALWRYADVGFTLLDETNMNIDVESISWAPANGGVISETYPEFEMRLATASVLPDEFQVPLIAPQPAWPASGPTTSFGGNYLDASEDPGAVVHPKHLGYTISPANLYTANSGTTMLPFPLNQGQDMSSYRYYTWRDTAIESLGGPFSSGAPFDQDIFLRGLPTTKFYGPGSVPSMGLPLLMEFRCYPDDSTLGLNRLDASSSPNTPLKPDFRAFTTGGYDQVGNRVTRNPDLQDVALGGYAAGGGAPTAPTDSTFYMGELGLVTRVSRSTSIWFDTTDGESGVGSPLYAQPIVESLAAALPEGTQIELAFRGAVSITAPSGQTVPNDITTNATLMDSQGNPWFNQPSSPVFLNGDSSWKDDISAIDSAKYFQVRISFTSNAASGLTPALSTLAFAYRAN